MDGAKDDAKDELDCTACGVCCHGMKVVLYPEDEARLSADEVLTLTKLDDEAVERTMRQVARKRCIALRVEGGRYLCSIYDRRPGVCIAFERGGRRCLERREVAPLR
jgi:Fe-S-cluster containining protein